MGTKNNPGGFDCHAKARPDEPTFTLLGRDPAAAAAIRYWCLERQKQGKNSAGDAQLIEAYQLADSIDRYTTDRNGSDLA